MSLEDNENITPEEVKEELEDALSAESALMQKKDPFAVDGLGNTPSAEDSMGDEGSAGNDGDGGDS